MQPQEIIQLNKWYRKHVGKPLRDFYEYFDDYPSPQDYITCRLKLPIKGNIYYTQAVGVTKKHALRNCVYSMLWIILHYNINPEINIPASHNVYYAGGIPTV